MIMKERRDYMFTLVRQWRESGLTRHEFCQQHGVSLSRFGYWISRLKEAQSAGEGSFIPVGILRPSGHTVLSVIYPSLGRT